MIDFMLNNLRRPVTKGFDAGLEFSGLPLYFDSIIAYINHIVAMYQHKCIYKLLVCSTNLTIPTFHADPLYIINRPLKQ